MHSRHLFARSAAVAALLLGVACSDRTPLDVTPDGAFPITTLAVTGTVDFGGRMAIRGDTLRATLLLQNASADSVAYVDYGACSIGFRLYATSERKGQPAYYNRLPSSAGCPDVAYRITLPPSRVDSIVTTVVQGDGAMPQVPPGHYWFALATVFPSGVRQLVSAGQGDVP